VNALLFQRYRFIFLRFLCIGLSLFASIQPQVANGEEAKNRFKKEITADHSQFKELQQEFTSGDEVSKACLSCHNRADDQVKRTYHWLWHIEGNTKLGKGGLIGNNFCISSNMLGDTSCLDCHIGWNGKKGEVNCLVCHSMEGMNWKEAFADIRAFTEEGDEDSLEIAQELQEEVQSSIIAIGSPTAKNCGGCHFYSGGGDGVKRGDMDSSLVHPPRELDVHLSKDGAGLECIDCHNTRNHQVPGRQASISAREQRENLGQPDFASYLRCEACHTSTPHHESILNHHFDFLSCQTCHIPHIGRGNPTKVSWDWSKAGQLKDGKRYNTKDELGKKNYMTIKGEFHWEKNVIPHYAWYDGKMKNTTFAEKVEPGSVVDVQVPSATADEKNAKIHPFKVHRGKQPWDPVLSKLVAPMLSGEQGFWETLDWDIAIPAGMSAMDLPYSGEYDFIESQFMYPVHHTIAPKENALGCDSCHHRAADGSGSRMAGVPGTYVPGRGDLINLTKYAWLAVILICIAAVFHAGSRVFFKARARALKNDNEKTDNG
jgi:octaheme c-type cytochrome (tetrathionate reductase family)